MPYAPRPLFKVLAGKPGLRELVRSRMPMDPYHVWLGIPPEEQPPNHYRLLGIAMFESQPDVIATAADRQMGHLRTFSRASTRRFRNAC